MSRTSAGHGHAPGRATSVALTGGVVVAATCFAVSILAEVVGMAPGDGEMTDLSAVLAGLPAFSPWAWASLGAYAIVVTPVVGLVVTGWEYASVGDRPAVALAAAVGAVLALGVLLAVVR